MGRATQLCLARDILYNGLMPEEMRLQGAGHPYKRGSVFLSVKIVQLPHPWLQPSKEVWIFQIIAKVAVLWRSQSDKQPKPE